MDEEQLLALNTDNIKNGHPAEDPFNELSVSPGVYYPRKRYRRLYKNRIPRAVFKNGDFNVDKPKSNHRIRIFSDWFIGLVEARWRWTVTNFIVAYICNWIFFGAVYWAIAAAHGDLLDQHLPPNQNNTNWTPCIDEIYGFTSTLLFSVEVHTTVAYGKRAITFACPQAVMAMCLQCIFSSIFQAFMVGILFAKLTRPKSRTQTILFSKNAVITLRNKKMCMIFRVGDMRKSRILDIKASAYVIKLKTECLQLEDFRQIKLHTELDGCDSTFFLWPVSVIHIINENSPLYNLSAVDLLCGNIEILVVLEGHIESTGQPVQAKSSYTESEILWGHRLVSMVHYNHKNKVFDVDFSKLSTTERVDTPLCSTFEFETFVKEWNDDEFCCE